MSVKPTVKVIVVSDTVFKEPSKDVSGNKAIEILRNHGYRVKDKDIVPNDFKEIYNVVVKAVEESDIVLLIGGTGPSPRDITVDVVEKLAWRKLPGFGELFRYLTYTGEGAKAIYTRAEMFLVGKSVVVVLPGSVDAVVLALEKILVNNIDHVVEELRRLHGPHKHV